MTTADMATIGCILIGILPQVPRSNLADSKQLLGFADFLPVNFALAGKPGVAQVY